MRKIKNIFEKFTTKYLLNVLCKLYMILYKLYHVQLCLGMPHVFHSPDITVFVTLFDLKLQKSTNNGFKNDSDGTTTTDWPQIDIAFAITYSTYILTGRFLPQFNSYSLDYPPH